MSRPKLQGVTQTTVTLDDDVFAEAGKIMERGNYRTKSEVISRLMREALAARGWKSPVVEARKRKAAK